MQVYGSEMGPPGATMMELHSNFAVLGSTTVKDGVNPTQHSMHETLEVTHGFTDWFEIGFNIFSSIQPGGGWQWVGDHIRPRLTVPEAWYWPVGLSLAQEFGYQQRSFSEDTWTWEIRPIIDKKAGRIGEPCEGTCADFHSGGAGSGQLPEQREGGVPNRMPPLIRVPPDGGQLRLESEQPLGIQNSEYPSRHYQLSKASPAVDLEQKLLIAGAAPVCHLRENGLSVGN